MLLWVFVVVVFVVVVVVVVVFFNFLFYLGFHSGVITCSPMKPMTRSVPTSLTRDGFSLLICSERHICKQWEIAILILINTFASVVVEFFFLFLSVLGQFIHTERRRVYLGKSIQALQNDTLSYNDYSISGSSGQHCSGIALKLLRLFSSILIHYRNFPRQYI